MPRGALLLLSLFLLSSCAERELPEKGSADAELYASRCSGCHELILPRALAPAMWKFQMDRMDQKFRNAHREPPSGEERQRLLNYLQRNAGG